MLPKQAYYHYTTARPYLFRDECRDGENRTPVSRTRIVYTTAVLHPARNHLIMQDVDNQIKLSELVCYYNVIMRKDKEKITTLRKEGWSYQRLVKELGVPRATLSDWFGKEKWSQDIKNSLNKRNLEVSKIRMIRLDEIRGENLEQMYAEARREAAEDFERLKHHPLFVAGIMIYWGEGDKVSKHGFRVTNSDPLLIKIFLEFLRKICLDDEKRIRAWVLIYPDLNAESCENYWAKQLGLSRKNFTKSIMIQGRHKSRRVNNGICTLSYSSRFLKEKMLIWMSLLAQDLIKR